MQALESHARFEIVEQCVVARAVALQVIGLLYLEAHQLLERRLVVGERFGPARMLPGLVRGRALLRHRTHKRLRQLGCLIARTPRLTHHRLLGNRQIWQGSGRLDRLAIGRIDHSLMRNRRNRRAMVCTRAAPTRRTHRLLIPAKQTHHPTQVTQLIHPRLKGAPGIAHSTAP